MTGGCGRASDRSQPVNIFKHLAQSENTFYICEQT